MVRWGDFEKKSRYFGGVGLGNIIIFFQNEFYMCRMIEFKQDKTQLKIFHPEVETNWLLYLKGLTPIRFVVGLRGKYLVWVI